MIDRGRAWCVAGTIADRLSGFDRQPLLPLIDMLQSQHTQSVELKAQRNQSKQSSAIVGRAMCACSSLQMWAVGAARHAFGGGLASPHSRKNGTAGRPLAIHERLSSIDRLHCSPNQPEASSGVAATAVRSPSPHSIAPPPAGPPPIGGSSRVVNPSGLNPGFGSGGCGCVHRPSSARPFALAFFLWRRRARGARGTAAAWVAAAAIDRLIGAIHPVCFIPIVRGRF